MGAAWSWLEVAAAVAGSLAAGSLMAGLTAVSLVADCAAAVGGVGAGWDVLSSLLPLS
jgi:hypothetical protein